MYPTTPVVPKLPVTKDTVCIFDLDTIIKNFKRNRGATTNAQDFLYDIEYIARKISDITMLEYKKVRLHCWRLAYIHTTTKIHGVASLKLDLNSRNFNPSIFEEHTYYPDLALNVLNYELMN